MKQTGLAICLLLVWPLATQAEEAAAETKPPEKAEGAEAKQPEAKPAAEAPAEAGDLAAKLAQAEEEKQQLREQLADAEKKLTELQAQHALLQKELAAREEINTRLQARLAGKDLAKVEQDIKTNIASFRGTTSERFKARGELLKLGKLAVPSLIKATREDHPYVVETAIQTLGDIGDYRAVTPLLEVLSGKSLELGRHAVRALEKITQQYYGSIGLGETDQERLEVIVKWKKWWEENSEELLKANP